MHTIAYSSQSLIREKDVERELKNILDVAQNYNLENGITGVLFFSDNIFLQILEGHQVNLRTLMKKIEDDRRHENVTYLMDHKVQDRTLSGWSMQIFNLNNKNKLSLEDLQKTTHVFTSAFFNQDEKMNAEVIYQFYNSLLK